MTSETAISRLYVLLGMKSTLGEDTKKAESEVKAFEKTILDASKKVGAGLTAIGGAAILLADNSRKLNADLGQTALQLGITTDEMRALTLETTNITFPLEDTVATFDLLTRAGMRNTVAMQETANALSDLGTAMGYNASELAEILIPAFNAFDIPLEEAGDHVDTFTHLLRNTTVDLTDYASMVNYLAPQLDTMNLTMEESVAVMEALADRGIQGGAATREFRKAASAAEGDVKKFYAALGMTNAEVEVYAKEVRDATGITKEYADVATTQYGMLDHLKQMWAEVSFQVGSAIEPFEGVALAATTLGGVMMGLGPTLQLVSAAKTAYTAATAAATTATRAFTVALMANPAALVAIGITALALALGGYYLTTRTATNATKDLNEVQKSELELARDRAAATQKQVDQTKEQIRYYKDLIETNKRWAEVNRVADDIEARTYLTALLKNAERDLEALNTQLEETSSRVRELEDAEVRLEMSQSQHDVDVLESSLSKVLGLMEEISGEDRARAELEDTEAIQEIRVRTSQKDLDAARAALKDWEKGGDNLYAVEFGATAAREEHQRLIDNVTKAQVDLNRATRDYEDTQDKLNDLAEHYANLNDDLVGAIAGTNSEFEDLGLTLGDVADGLDAVIEKYKNYIDATLAGQERQRQIALLYGEDVGAPSYPPTVSGRLYDKGFDQDAAGFETTEGGGMRRTPAGDRETIPTATSVVARYAVEPLPAIEVDEPDPVVVDVGYALDPLPAIEVEDPDPVTIEALYVGIGTDALQAETRLNEIREIRNRLDADAALTSTELYDIYVQIEEQIPEIGAVHETTVDGMIGKLDEYIRRQEVAIANMRELSSGGSTVIVRTDNNQPERSAATGMSYVPRDMNIRVHQGEAIVPASQAAGRNVTVNINGPVVRDDRDIDLLANALYRRLQRA